MSYGRSGRYEIPSDGTISGALVAALLASLTFAELIAATGHLEAIPALYGLEDSVNNWGFVVGHGFVGAVAFAAGLTRAANHRSAPAPLAAALRSPFLGGCFGVAYGTLCWLVGIAHGVPLLVQVTGGTMAVPCQHGASLLALVGYGAVLGAWYPLVRTAVDDRGRSRRWR
ncbi:hypothetical protein ACFO5R_21355 [Halosolutus amylolyticus]|uniref:Uncharacterized protein n=1 Tax=Halosolutus amylolyticus TaxID=2932267 RepID=A0ABD5PV81_9EURY|nr:hypothetical protein [Halosolutus amylolyticus]